MPACRYFLIRINETDYLNRWDTDDGPRPDDVWSVYLCSPDIGVHLCEAAPSTWCEHVETYATFRDDAPDDAAEAVRQGVRESDLWLEWGTDADHYRHRSDVMRLFPELAAWLAANPEPEDKIHTSGTWAFVGICDPDTDDGAEYLEKLGEYVRCNAVL